MGDTVQLYYSTENTREFKEVEEQSLEVGIELAPAVEHLIGSYPKWTKVEELPVEQLEERMKTLSFSKCHPVVRRNRAPPWARSSPASTRSTCTRDCMESGSSTRRPGLSRRSRSLLRSRWEPRTSESILA